MTDTNLKALAEKVELAHTLDASTAAQAMEAIEANLDRDATGHAPEISTLDRVDTVIQLVDRVLPNWVIKMEGLANEPNGHWHCSLRRQAYRDNDELIGIGKGPVLAHALLGALLKVIAFRAPTEPA